MPGTVSQHNHRDVQTLSMNCNCRDLGSFCTVAANKRQRLSQRAATVRSRLSPPRRHLRNLQLGNLYGFLKRRTMRITFASRQGCPRPQTSFSTSAAVGARLSPPQRNLYNSHDDHNRDIDHLVEEELENLHGQQDHGDQPLRHGMSTTCTTTQQGRRPLYPRATGEF